MKQLVFISVAHVFLLAAAGARSRPDPLSNSIFGGSTGDRAALTLDRNLAKQFEKIRTRYETAGGTKVGRQLPIILGHNQGSSDTISEGGFRRPGSEDGQGTGMSGASGEGVIPSQNEEDIDQVMNGMDKAEDEGPTRRRDDGDGQNGAKNKDKDGKGVIAGGDGEDASANLIDDGKKPPLPSDDKEGASGGQGGKGLGEEQSPIGGDDKEKSLFNDGSGRWDGANGKAQSLGGPSTNPEDGGDSKEGNSVSGAKNIPESIQGVIPGEDLEGNPESDGKGSADQNDRGPGDGVRKDQNELGQSSVAKLSDKQGGGADTESANKRPDESDSLIPGNDAGQVNNALEGPFDGTGREDPEKKEGRNDGFPSGGKRLRTDYSEFDSPAKGVQRDQDENGEAGNKLGTEDGRVVSGQNLGQLDNAIGGPEENTGEEVADKDSRPNGGLPSGGKREADGYQDFEQPVKGIRGDGSGEIGEGDRLEGTSGLVVPGQDPTQLDEALGGSQSTLDGELSTGENRPANGADVAKTRSSGQTAGSVSVAEVNQVGQASHTTASVSVTDNGQVAQTQSSFGHVQTEQTEQVSVSSNNPSNQDLPTVTHISQKTSSSASGLSVSQQSVQANGESVTQTSATLSHSSQEGGTEAVVRSPSENEGVQPPLSIKKESVSEVLGESPPIDLKTDLLNTPKVMSTEESVFTQHLPSEKVDKGSQDEGKEGDHIVFSENPIFPTVSKGEERELSGDFAPASPGNYGPVDLAKVGWFWDPARNSPKPPKTTGLGQAWRDKPSLNVRNLTFRRPDALPRASVFPSASGGTDCVR